MDEEVGIGDQKNMVFSGSMVVYGRATYVVTSCGMNTQVGKIANLLETAENKQTPLQQKLDDFGKKLGVAIVILAALIFALEVFRGGDLMNSFMFAIAIAVAAIHVIVSFRIIKMIMVILSLGSNMVLFVWCTLFTVIVFCIIYALVYALTAKEYYNIVQG